MISVLAGNCSVFWVTCLWVCVCVPVNNPICPPDKSLKVIFLVPIGNSTEYYTFAPVCLCMNTHNSICLPLCVPLDHPLCSLCNKTHTKPTAVLSCVAKPIRTSLMKLMHFNEIWGSQFETAKIEKIIKDFTPASNLAVLLISKNFIQVGPLTPQS